MNITYIHRISDMHLLRRAAPFLLATAVLACLVLITFFALLPNPEDYYSEFYLLDKNGLAFNYPTVAAPGGTATVIIGVVNHEQNSLDYTVHATSGGAIIKSINTGVLQPGQQREGLMDIPGSEVKEGRIEFYLYTGNNTQLHIKQPLVLRLEVE